SLTEIRTPRMKSREKVRSKTPPADQPIKMRVAAALVYHQITGKTRDAASEPDYEVALSDTAIALSQVADIFYVNGEGRLARITEDGTSPGKLAQPGEA